MKFSIYLNRRVFVMGCAYAAMQTTLLPYEGHIKSLNKTGTSIFVLLFVLCFEGQPFMDFNHFPL